MNVSLQIIRAGINRLINLKWFKAQYQCLQPIILYVNTQKVSTLSNY